MATPLTLYVPIKQDADSQAAAEKIYQSFATDVHDGLQASGILHYARFALVPNAVGTPGYLALLLITTFDGAMNPYLQFFWQDDKSIYAAFQAIMAIALNPPNPPIAPDDLNGFENFVTAHNLNQPADLYQAYPQTVLQIENAFTETSPAA